MSSTQPRGRVFIVDTGITTSHNIDSPHPPVSSTGFVCTNPRSAFQTHTVDNRFPWLPLVPRTPTFSSEAFGLLRQYRVEEFPGSRYSLDRDSIQGWIKLEDILTTLCRELRNHAIVSKSVPPHEPIPCPQEYGFRDLYRQREQLVDAVEKSRDAFAILMSWATFLLLCLEPTLGKEQPAWLNHLSSLSVDNDFITLLRQSELWVGWDRVGLLFNDSCEYPHHTKIFMKTGIPMWLLWGKHKPSERPNSLFTYLRPTNQEVNIARKKTLTPRDPKTPRPSSPFTSTWGSSSTAPSSSNSWGDSAWGKATGGSWGPAESPSPSLGTWRTSSTAPSFNSWGDSAWGKATGGGWGSAESSSPSATWGTPLTAPSSSNLWGDWGDSARGKAAESWGSWGPAMPSSPLSLDHIQAPPERKEPSNSSIQLPTPSKGITWGERQKPFEGWRDFLTRRCRARAKVIQQEDARGRQSRRDRELGARKKHFPGHKGPRVFVWEEDPVTSHIIRRNVTRGEITIGAWGNYSNKCKVYDSIWNEWDIIEELADCPDRPWDDDSDDSDANFHSYFNPSSRNNIIMSTDGEAVARLPTPTSVVSDLSGVAGMNDVVMSTDSAAIACSPTPQVISDLSGMAGGNDTVMSTDNAAVTRASTPISVISEITDSAAIARSPTPQVISDLSGMAGRNNKVMSTDNAAVARASIPILVISEITMASSTISMISELTSYVISDFTSTGSDVNNSASSSISTVSDLTSSSGLISVAAPSIPPSTPSTTSSLIDPPQTLASLTAFPIAFNDKRYDLYINFDWKRPVFADWAYERWGYLEVVPLPPVEMKVDIKAVCSAVGYTLDYIPTKERGPFAEFFNHIIQNPAVIPGECWDLNGQFQECLPRSPTDLRVSILYRNSDDQPLYIVKPRVPQTPCPTWTLLLRDPITVMQIFRRHNGSTIYNSLRHLLYYGIPFSTTIPKDMLPPPLPFRGVPTLGWRPVGHRVKPSEYTFYHDQLLYFFKQPYSHAAFGMGGIVWRLARAMVNDDFTDSLVMNGPSDSVGNSYSTERFTNGSILCDDSLTEQELDFICGVYKIATGNAFFFLLSISCRTNMSYYHRSCGPNRRCFLVAQTQYVREVWPLARVLVARMRGVVPR